MYVFLPACLDIFLPVCMSVRRSASPFAHPSFHPYVRTSDQTNDCLFVCPSVSRYVGLYLGRPPVQSSVRPFPVKSVRLPIIRQYVRLSVSSSVHSYVRTSVRPPNCSFAGFPVCTFAITYDYWSSLLKLHWSFCVSQSIIYSPICVAM